MHTFQILDATGHSVRPPFNTYPPVALGRPGPLVDDSAAIQAVRAAIECLLDDSVSLMHAHKYYVALKQPLTLSRALQLQQELMAEITHVKAARKEELRRSIAQVISDSPKFFNHTWYGRNKLHYFSSVMTDRQATWRQLELAYLRATEAQEIWDRCNHLVEYAIGEGEEIQIALRRAARDPNMTLADEQAIVRDLAGKLFSANRTPGLPVCRTFRRLYDMLMDSHTPAQLLDAISQTIKPLTLPS